MPAVMVYAIGGGLIEVLISPVLEACPTDNKESAMSLLHSFYCWGCTGVVLVSTLFFAVFGTSHWKILALIWVILPAAIKRGGTVLFAMLALAGDLGCSGGPTLVGFVSSAFSGNLRLGILTAIVFPVLLLAGLCTFSRLVVKNVD